MSYALFLVVDAVAVKAKNYSSCDLVVENQKMNSIDQGTESPTCFSYLNIDACRQTIVGNDSNLLIPL